MIGDILGSGIGTVIAGYETLAGMFGSPATLAAISVALIVIALIELYVRNCRKRAKEEA